MIVALYIVPLFLGITVASDAKAPCLDLLDGNKIPMLALGTGRGTAKKNESTAIVRDAVLWAIQAGYRHIDTAAIYGDEKEVGQGIADAIANGIVTRDQIFVTTKLWNDRHSKNDVVPALTESLGRLGLDYVDLYLIHFPIATKADGSPSDIDYLETWQGMEEAKTLGLTRSIGVSNFNAEQLDRLIASSRMRPVVNEIEVNPTNTQEALILHCQHYGMAVMAYSPFGFLVSRSNDRAVPPRYDDPFFVATGKKYRKTPGQIVLRYLLSKGLIPIPKSTSPDRISENIDVFDFELTPEEIANMDQFNKNMRVYNFENWRDYPNYPF